MRPRGCPRRRRRPRPERTVVSSGTDRREAGSPTLHGRGSQTVAAGAAVNFIAHVHVALSAVAAGPHEDDLAFGAALPDLASMAGLRLDRAALPETVGEGVAVHHRTDAAFHSLEAFTAGVRQLDERLQARGLAVGPSRAVGHAGWELLLDGCLLERAGVEAGFTRVLEHAPDVAAAVLPADPDRWRGLVASLRSERWWLGYGDAEIVACRLRRLLQARRRLSFSVEEIPRVAEVLAAAKPGVDLATDGVVAAVVATVSRNRREAGGYGHTVDRTP